MIPVSAPTETKRLAQGSPFWRKASEMGALMLIWSLGIIPVSTPATAM